MRVKFSIRFIVVITGAFAVVFSLYSCQSFPALQRLNAIRYFEENGMVTQRTSNGVIPINIDDQVRMASSVERVYLTGSILTEEDFSRLGRIKDVSVLSLNSSNFDDEMARDLSALTQLRELHLNGTLISSIGLCTIADDHDLEFLTLNKTTVGDEAVDAIVKMKNLGRLEIYNTRISSFAVERIKLELPHCVIGY